MNNKNNNMQPALMVIPPPPLSYSPEMPFRSGSPPHANVLTSGVNNNYAPADATRTLFLGDLSYFCTEQDLCRLFLPYGGITSVRVRRGVTGESLMHGFITLGSPEAALRAMRDLDGTEFMGRNMRVQLSTDGQRPNPVAKENFVQVHVSFISKQTNILVSERVLREIFAPFGRIADVTIKKHTLVAKQNRQSGYGFVYYFDVEAANHAMSLLKQNTVHDITFDCSISYKSQHDKHANAHGHGHGRLHTPHAHSMNDMSRWNINAPPDVHSFTSGLTSSNSFSSGHSKHFPQHVMSHSRSHADDFVSSGLTRSASAHYGKNYGNNSGSALHANLGRGPVSPPLSRERHLDHDSRIYTEEELEAELARMSLALHQHYQAKELERERERERELARLTLQHQHQHQQPSRTLSGRDWDEQSHPSFTSGSVSRSHGPLEQVHSFHSLSSISQGSSAYHPQPRTRAQLTRFGPQFDSFSSDDEPVTTIETFSMNDLDRLLPPPPEHVSSSALRTRDVHSQQQHMRLNAFPEDQAKALNQLVDFDFNQGLNFH